MYLSIVPASSIPNIAALSFLTDKGIHFLIFLLINNFQITINNTVKIKTLMSIEFP